MCIHVQYLITLMVHYISSTCYFAEVVFNESLPRLSITFNIGSNSKYLSMVGTLNVRL